MVLSLATYRGLGRRAWAIRPGLTLWCSIYAAGRKPHWWVSIEEAPTDRKDDATGFGCTPELDSVEVPEILKAINTLRTMNAENRRSLPEDAPTEFIPQKLQRFVQDNGTINRQAWECALLLSVRDELKSGNLAVAESKRFGQFHQFFIADSQWAGKREKFFERAGLPSSPANVPTYLTARLNRAYDAFLQSQSDNSYATVDENGWHLSADPAEKLGEGDEQKLQLLRNWLAGRVRTIRLPQLLIEVDNELNFTRHFVNPARRELRRTDDVCSVLVTILALGCNIGPSTMARLTDDVSYDQIKRIVD